MYYCKLSTNSMTMIPRILQVSMKFLCNYAKICYLNTCYFMAEFKLLYESLLDLPMPSEERDSCKSKVKDVTLLYSKLFNDS